MRVAPSYGVRSRQASSNSGVRPTARTYGKARIGTYAAKADGHITLESDAERLTSQLLSIDPRVRSFKQQPFTVDLASERLLFTREEVSEARRTRGGHRGASEYTPDFATVQADGLQRAYEVKVEGHEGEAEYWAKVELARPILDAYCYPLLTVVVPADERHPALVNAQLLKPALARAAAYLSIEVIERVEDYCAAGSVLQSDLCAELQISANLIPVLLISGVLQANLSRHHICGTLELSAAGGDLGHLCLIESFIAENPSTQEVWP
jgi:hypothetical protein